MPQRTGIQRGAVGIERIDTVIFRGNKYNVMDAALGHGEILHVEGLRINLPIHGIAENLAERTGVYVRRGQSGFLQVLSRMLVIILASQNVHRSIRGERCFLRKGERGQENEGKGQHTMHRNLQTILRFPGGSRAGICVLPNEPAGE